MYKVKIRILLILLGTFLILIFPLIHRPNNTQNNSNALKYLY